MCWRLAPCFKRASRVPSEREARTGRELAMMRWGHVPYWAKDLSIGAKQTNAWAEEVPRTAREQAEREQKTREWVAKPKTVEDLLKRFGRIWSWGG